MAISVHWLHEYQIRRRHTGPARQTTPYLPFDALGQIEKPTPDEDTHKDCSGGQCRPDNQLDNQSHKQFPVVTLDFYHLAGVPAHVNGTGVRWFQTG